jgi:Uma2 family endonuclease
MSTAIAEAPDEAITFADLLHELGDIPPSRIVMRPPPGTATEDDVLRLIEAPRKRLCELIDGVLVEKAMGWKESALAIYVASSLSGFVRPRNLGLIAGADGTIKLWAGRVRIPDVAYISWDRLPGRRMPEKPIPQIAPEIAVEVLSESNTEREMEKKRVDYFKIGVKLLWEIDPEGRTVTVYTSPEDSRLLKENEILDGEEVLPGYTLKLAELFAELDRHG